MTESPDSAFRVFYCAVQAISYGYNNSIPYLLNVFTGGVHVGRYH